MAHARFVRVFEAVKRVPPVFDRGVFRNKMVKPADPPRYSAEVAAAGEASIVMRQTLPYDLDGVDLESSAVWTAARTERIALDATALKKDYEELAACNVCHVNNAYRLVLDVQERDEACLVLLGELPDKQQAWVRSLLEADSPAQLEFKLVDND